MKLGLENRNKMLAAVALAALALVLAARWLFAPGSSEPAAATAVVAPAPSRATQPSKTASKKRGAAPHSIDPTLRYDWLKESEETKYEGTGRNIFLSQAEIPQPLAPGHTDPTKLANTGPPPPPPPPPINLKFYGYASRAGEPKRVFLSQGEDLFIAGEGEIIDRRYKVLHILPMSVEIEDVLSNNRQSIPLTQG